MTFSVNTGKPPQQEQVVTFRKTKSICTTSFKLAISNSELLNPEAGMNIEERKARYNTVLGNILDDHAPEKTRKIIVRPRAPWYNDDLKDAKRQKRKCERIWKKTNLEIDHKIFQEKCIQVNQLVQSSKKTYFSSEVLNCGKDQKSLFKITDHLLGKKKDTVLPTVSSSKRLAVTFSDYFEKKIQNIYTDTDREVW